MTENGFNPELVEERIEIYHQELKEIEENIGNCYFGSKIKNTLDSLESEVSKGLEIIQNGNGGELEDTIKELGRYLDEAHPRIRSRINDRDVNNRHSFSSYKNLRIAKMKGRRAEKRDMFRSD